MDALRGKNEDLHGNILSGIVAFYCRFAQWKVIQ